MRLIIVRHGETSENLENITQGQFDSSLNYYGLTQVKIMAQYLRNEDIDFVVSSDLVRCSATAQEILHYHDVPLETSPLLREQARGVFELRPKHWSAFDRKNSGLPYHEWLPEGGETLIDVWNRVIPYFQELQENYSDKTVLYVGHRGVIACVQAYFHGKTVAEYLEFKPRKHATISIVQIHGDDVEFEKLNSVNHLN